MEMPKGAELLAQAGKRLRANFESIREGIPHSGERGRETQDALMKFLNAHLPKRYTSTSGFIIDSRNTVSRHLDAIVYDQLDALAFSPAEGTLIIPNDNVAAVLEVKSTLSKAELEAAADQIAHVKALVKLPPQPSDAPLAEGGLQLTATRGIVFGYSSATSIDSLAANLEEINAASDSDLWIDEIAILDRGCISYAMSVPVSGARMLYGGKASPNAIPFPTYVVLEVSSSPEAVLPSFMARLTSHLTHYRRRPGVRLDMLIPQGLSPKPRGAYWFNTGGKLIPVPGSMIGSGSPAPKPAVRLTFLNGSGQEIGRAEWFSWADGHVWALNLDGLPAPGLVADALFRPYGRNIKSIPAGQHLQLTNILPGTVPPDMERTLENLSGPHLPFRLRVERFKGPDG
jgi:hypothetical protein